VVCGNVYVEERDAHGFERLAPYSTATASSGHVSDASASRFSVHSSSTAKGKAADRGTANEAPQPLVSAIRFTVFILLTLAPEAPRIIRVIFF
jgi:hypothetical protein